VAACFSRAAVDGSSNDSHERKMKWVQQPVVPVFAKKKTLGKFDAKAFFGVRRGASDVVFREESEFEVKNDPNLIFSNI